MDPDIFRNTNVLITGGLGFIGSNLAIRLVKLGAKVTLVDAMIDGHGGNVFNIEPVRGDVVVNYSNVCDETVMGYLVRGRDFIFHLAGQNDHVLSQTNPFLDIEYNIKGSAILLEACKKHNRNARIVYTGTRGEYGSTPTLPVSEETPPRPKGIYELSSLTAQSLFRIYHENQGVRSVTLRLTNIYGERAQMQHHRFGVANWFVRVALDGGTIKVFGDGSIKRDFVYIHDAVDAILAVAANEQAYGQVFNVGDDQPSSFLTLAKTIIEVAQRGRWELAPFTPERAAQEPGDYYSDIRKIQGLTGWRPTTSLADGVRQTIEFYRKHQAMYW